MFRRIKFVSASSLLRSDAPRCR